MLIEEDDRVPTDIKVRCRICMRSGYLILNCWDGNFWLPPHGEDGCKFVWTQWEFATGDRRGEGYLDAIKTLREIGR